MMTPEPTGGIYAVGRDFHADTGLALTVSGYDAQTGQIEDMDSALSLITRDDQIAALWSFRGMMAHWNRKHARAAYVPPLNRGSPPEYRYGPQVKLFEGTDFLLFLSVVATGDVYYDPAVKMVDANGNYTIKRRSEFRVKHKGLGHLYQAGEVVDLT